MGICIKCGTESGICRDGKCDLCHNRTFAPDDIYFRDSESARVVDEEDFTKALVKLPNLERLSCENRKR